MQDFKKYARIIRELRVKLPPEVIRQLYQYAPEWEGIQDFLSMWDLEENEHEKRLILLAMLSSLKEIDAANKIEVK